MQIIPYVPIPKLKVIGASFFVLGLATIGVLGLRHHHSGEVVAELETTKPLPKTDLGQQAMQAMSQSYLQNKMNQMGLPTYQTDEIETLSFDFPPVHLTPEMGAVTFLFEVRESGITARDKTPRFDRRFISKDYMIKDAATNTVIFQDKAVINHTVNPDENGKHATIALNPQRKEMGGTSGWRYETAALLEVPKASDYVLQASVKKFKFAYPVDSIKLIVKKGMMEKPSVRTIVSLLGLIIFGAVLCIMATPPEKRKAKRKIHLDNNRPF